MIRFTSSTFSIDAAQDGTPKRTITGIALPYNTEATVSGGQVVSFLPGSLPTDGKNPKLYMSHDASQAIGLVSERTDDETAMYFTAKVSTTALGDEALVLAADGVLDSVSVGVNPTKFTFNDEGTMIVEAADWLELSLVPQPAFAGATIEKVLASIPTSDEEMSNNTETAPDEPEPTEPQETEVSETPVPEVIEASTVFAQPKRKFDLPTPGEYLAAMHIGGTTFDNVAAAARDYVASKQSAFQFAAGDVLTTDTPGLLPVPVLGPVFANLNQQIRPVVAAIGARAYPDGGTQKTFIRPTWTTHTSVATQSTELSAVSATTPVIASNVVGKTTLAGQVQLSIQDVDFTSPGSMDIIINDLMGQYMQASDNLAADGLVAGAAASGATWTVTANDPSSLISAIYTSAYNILLASNFLPDHIFVSPNVWQALGAQLDVDKRPVFPYVGAAGLMGVNGMGSADITVANTFNPFGLNLVADRNFAAGTMVVARGAAIEFYESIRGLLTRDEPSTLGKVMSYHGYASLFVADATQVQKIALA
jgi:HK97 family phage prohead protease